MQVFETMTRACWLTARDKNQRLFLSGPTLVADLEREEIIVVHDPLEFEGHLNGQDLAIHGHTHRYRKKKSMGRFSQPWRAQE